MFKITPDRPRKEKPLKLGICLPVTNVMMHVATAMSMWMLQLPENTQVFVPEIEVGGFADNIAQVRNNLVEQALAAECTDIALMDTDQTYTANTIMKLLSHRKKVISAPVHRRYPPFEAILNRGTIGSYYHVPDEECYSGKLIEIDSTGTGCILVAAEVFKLLEPPWFTMNKEDLPLSREVLKELGKKPVGEDTGFCYRVRTLGYPIFCDTSIRIGHLGYMEFDREFYEINKKRSGLQWAKQPVPERSNSIGG